jgi:hypothetical protein
MKSGDLSRDQLAKMQAAVWPMLNYLLRLNRRMNQVFVPTDPLFRVASEAYNAVHSLNVALHYLACDALKAERDGPRQLKPPPAGESA